MSEVTAVQRALILTAGARLLARLPIASIRLSHIANDVAVGLDNVVSVFPTMHALGTAILDHERASMHRVQERAAALDDPLQRITLAFRLVGENLARDIVVRAGVRIAAESRDAFPERRLDPFRTWDGFVRAQLSSAESDGARLALEIDRAVWLVVAAGMGAKDLIAFHGTWADAPELLERTAADSLAMLVSNS